MTLHIILTSYNRPLFLRRALDSLIAQQSPDWVCHLMDDGSDDATLDVIWSFKDSRIKARLNHDYPIDRSAARYSVLINRVLPELSGGIVGYMCDNVEYAPGLVGNVLRYFKHWRHIFSGYVQHERDAWTRGGRYLGSAAIFNHWVRLPPTAGALRGDVRGMLDHSQVFHRLPVDLRWDESPAARPGGDGLFFTALADKYGPICPIQAGKVLTYEHLFE